MSDDLNQTSTSSTRGIYGMSVTSELTGIAAQTLRLYEQRGLLTPARTNGGTRRYSEDDLTRLRHIAELVEGGVNLAGVARILELENRNTELEADNAALTLDNTAANEAGSNSHRPQ